MTATTARSLAVDAMLRIEAGGYANIVVPALLDGTHLDERDRGFVTELTYGTTRMRRACDWLVSRHLSRPLDGLDAPVRAVLRLGAYQLRFLHTPPHAAVSASVDTAPRPARGFVNAVLRKVAVDDAPWPDLATELSYPDWIVDAIVHDLGAEAGVAALRQMNVPASVTERPDGYIQDEASQLVAAFVAAQPGTRTADLCAAPGGKATLMAEAGGFVVAADVRRNRTRLVQSNVRRLRSANVAVVRADARKAPFRSGAFDRVLVDAPCSGLGVLRRRPDARWTRRQHDIADLVVLQRELLTGAVPLLAPGGTLVYSVCTLTLAETEQIDEWLRDAHPDLEPIAAPAAPFSPLGRGARLLPQDAGTDGMYVVGLRARR